MVGESVPSVLVVMVEKSAMLCWHANTSEVLVAACLILVRYGRRMTRLRSSKIRVVRSHNGMPMMPCFGVPAMVSRLLARQCESWWRRS